MDSITDTKWSDAEQRVLSRLTDFEFLHATGLREDHPLANISHPVPHALQVVCDP